MTGAINHHTLSSSCQNMTAKVNNKRSHEPLHAVRLPSEHDSQGQQWAEPSPATRYLTTVKIRQPWLTTSRAINHHTLSEYCQNMTAEANNERSHQPLHAVWLLSKYDSQGQQWTEPSTAKSCCQNMTKRWHSLLWKKCSQ